MKHIGITGGIGSGKSMVCKVFSVLGIPVFHADTEAKQLYSNNNGLAEWIRNRFGEEVYAGGQFQPKVLAGKVFGFPDALAELNREVHPRLRAIAARWREQQHGVYTLSEAALMMESGSYADYDEIVLVEAPLNIRLHRILARDRVNEQQALQRIQAQWTDEQRRPLAQHLIFNDEQHAIIPQVLDLHTRWTSK